MEAVLWRRSKTLAVSDTRASRSRGSAPTGRFAALAWSSGPLGSDHIQITKANRIAWPEGVAWPEERLDDVDCRPQKGTQSEAVLEVKRAERSKVEAGVVAMFLWSSGNIEKQLLEFHLTDERRRQEWFSQREQRERDELNTMLHGMLSGQQMSRPTVLLQLYRSIPLLCQRCQCTDFHCHRSCRRHPSFLSALADSMSIPSENYRKRRGSNSLFSRQQRWNLSAHRPDKAWRIPIAHIVGHRGCIFLHGEERDTSLALGQSQRGSTCGVVGYSAVGRSHCVCKWRTGSACGRCRAQRNRVVLRF